MVDVKCSKCGGTGEAAADDPARYRAEVAAMVKEEAAGLIEASAKSDDESADIARDSSDKHTRELESMYRGDARDLRAVARLCRGGEFQSALKYARNMDTAAREGIPDKAWDFMELGSSS